MLKKLWTVLLAVILCAGAVLPVCLVAEQEVFIGSFSTDKTYSGDLLFYALQTAEQVESYREIVVTVYETASDTPVFSFRPGRASDHWGICWERDSYDIWVQSADTGTCCWEYLDGEWKRNDGRVCPEYIVSRWDSTYRDHPETWTSIYRTLTDPPAAFPAAEMVRAAVRDDFCCVIKAGGTELTVRGVFARAIFIEFFGTELTIEEDQTAGANSFTTADSVSFEFFAGSPENGGTFPVGCYRFDSQDRIAFSSAPGEDPVIVCKPADSGFGDRLGYVMLAVMMAGGNSDALSKEQIFSLVQEHHDFLLRCITDHDPDRAKEVTGIQSVHVEKDAYVEFYCGGSGLVPSSSYYGFYYSPDDLPLAVDVTVTENLRPEGNGFGWKQSGGLDGDNWYYTERIMENWYYYESHY